MSEKVKYRLQVGLWWDVDGHDIKVIAINGKEAKIREKWIAEDTLEVVIRTETYDVVVIGNEEYLHSKDYPEFRLAASGAFNYPFDESDLEEEEVDEHDYTSSTNRDYSPSNPWDAPGMSIKDFI